MTAGYDLLAETLAERGADIGHAEAALRAQEVETPSWAYGNSGTRFKVFPQEGVPRDAYEKVDDAATVHRYTGVAPSVALLSYHRELAPEIEERPVMHLLDRLLPLDAPT